MEKLVKAASVKIKSKIKNTKKTVNTETKAN